MQNAGLTDLRIIADEIQDGGKDNFSTHYMVKKDSGITTVADLKGKVLATNGVGTGVHMAMRAMLQQSGLQDKRDYTVIEAPFPTMKAVLLDGKADMIVSTTPFVFDPELQAKARVTCSPSAMPWGPRSCRSGPRARASSARTARRWSISWRTRCAPCAGISTPPIGSEAIDILARFLKQPPARFEGWVFTKNDFYRNPDGLVNLDALQNNIDLMRQLGIISAELDARTHASLDLVREAAQRLK